MALARYNDIYVQKCHSDDVLIKTLNLAKRGRTKQNKSGLGMCPVGGVIASHAQGPEFQPKVSINWHGGPP